LKERNSEEEKQEEVLNSQKDNFIKKEYGYITLQSLYLQGFLNYYKYNSIFKMVKTSVSKCDPHITFILLLIPSIGPLENG